MRARKRPRGARFGCGIDVVDMPRFQRTLRRGGSAFIRRVFRPGEVAYAQARPRTRLLHLAGRFAAKEAVIKAVSQVAPSRAPGMRDVEVRNDRLGRPRIILHGKARRLHVHISLSHVDTVAVASAIVTR